jgi:hypothetical protein
VSWVRYLLLGHFVSHASFSHECVNNSNLHHDWSLLVCVLGILYWSLLNAWIKSLRATLLDKIFTVDFSSWTVHFVNLCMKTNKCNNYSFSLLIMYCSSYMFRHYIAIFSAFWEMLNSGTVERILWMDRQYSIDCSSIKHLSEDTRNAPWNGNVMSKHVGATIHN